MLKSSPDIPLRRYLFQIQKGGVSPHHAHPLLIHFRVEEAIAVDDGCNSTLLSVVIGRLILGSLLEITTDAVFLMPKQRSV